VLAHLHVRVTVGLEVLDHGRLSTCSGSGVRAKVRVKGREVRDHARLRTRRIGGRHATVVQLVAHLVGGGVRGRVRVRGRVGVGVGLGLGFGYGLGVGLGVGL
jgi:hypothetical protein